LVNQQTDVTVADEATYAWKLLDGNAANAFSIGLTSANVYMQTWGSKPLYINSSLGGNNTIINATGGSVGIANTAPSVRLQVGSGGTGATDEAIIIDGGSGAAAVGTYLQFSRNSLSRGFVGIAGAANAFGTTGLWHG
jgi:hypothetical protein